MTVVVEEFDMDDMSFTVLGRIESGEVVEDQSGFLTELLEDADLSNERKLLERFNGPRLIAYPDTRNVGKSWIPYEGPRGGEGWQNSSDPDEVVYQEEPPGEVAEGYDEDHWSEYPSEGDWPDSPFGTGWKDPSGFGRSGGMGERDAVLFVNYDDELQVSRIEDFQPDEGTYKLSNGYVIAHSQVVAYSEPEEGNRVETSKGVVEVGDWVMYSDESGNSYNAQITDIELNEGHDVISVVGDDGYYEIEVTGTPGSRSEYNSKLMEVQEEPPGIYENVEENGMAMETDDVANQIISEIDLTAEDDADPSEQQLSQETRRSIRGELERYFPKQHVDSYYGSIGSWKINNASGTAAEHEQAFKEALGIDGPTHVEELRDEEPPEPSEVHKKIAGVMAEVSDEYWEKNFGGIQKVHRGISNTAFQELFRSWLENPSASEYELNQLALNNYTLNRGLASEFGGKTAIVSIEADTEDVALCTDFVSNIGTVEDESEVQIAGDSHTVNSRNIRLFGNRGPTIGDHPEDWYREEHHLFGSRVSSWYMRQADMNPEEPPLQEGQYRTLLEWGDAVEDGYPDLMDKYFIGTTIQQIRRDAETYYGIETAHLDKSDETPVLDLTHEEDATWMNDGSTPPQYERLSEELFEQLVEQNNRRRQESAVEDDPDDRGSSPMRLKSRVEIDNLRNPDTDVNEDTLQKAGDNFYQVDDLLIDAWEKQVCAESLEKAPNMWRRDDNVPQFVRSFVRQAATKRDALWDDYNDVPHMAALRVHEIIKDNLTNPNGWSIRTIANDLMDEFEGITRRQAETIARTEVAAVLNKARSLAYEASGEELMFYWSGPSDEHTTEICEETKTEVENRGGYVEKDVLQRILRRKARKYRDEGGTPERVDSFLPHFNCRHTLVRSEFRFL